MAGDVGLLQSRKRHILAVLTGTEDHFKRMICHLSLGGICEELKEFEAGFHHYLEGIGLLPDVHSPDTGVYFLFSNAGYCLIRLHRFDEAEEFCRKAVEMNPLLPNAHKNLGISLEGQERRREAAEAFMAATRLRPGDDTAFMHLKELLIGHPEVFEEHPHLAEGFVECANLVADVMVTRENRKYTGHA